MSGTVLPLLDMPSWCVQTRLDLYQFRYLKKTSQQQYEGNVYDVVLPFWNALQESPA